MANDLLDTATADLFGADVPDVPVIEANPALTRPIEHQVYVRDVVFTTGIAELDDVYVVASGEGDLACRITHIPKSRFRLT